MKVKLQGAGHDLPVGDFDEDDEKTRELISQEEDAANQYEMMADDADSDDAKHIYNDIADEEKVHAGELFLLLLQEDPSDGKGLKEGMKEASEELSGKGKDEDEDDEDDQDSADLDTMRGLMDTSFRDLFNMGREKILDKANGKDSVEKSSLAYRRRSNVESKDAPRGEGQVDPYDGIPPEQIANTERRLKGILHNFPSISDDSTIPDEEKPKRLAAHLQTVTGMPVRKVLKVFDYNRKNNNQMIKDLLNRHLEAKTPGITNVFDLQTHILSKYPDMDFKDAFQEEYSIPDKELARSRAHRESNKERTGHYTSPEHKVHKLGTSLDKGPNDTVSRVSSDKRDEEHMIQGQLDKTKTVLNKENYDPKLIHVKTKGQVGVAPVLQPGLNTKVTSAQVPKSGVGDITVDTSLDTTPDAPTVAINAAKEQIKRPVVSDAERAEQLSGKFNRTARLHRRASRETFADRANPEESAPADTSEAAPKNKGDETV